MTKEEKKYNVKVNQASNKPSSEDIKKHMDFEAAYKSYTHKVYRTPWYKFDRHAPKNRRTVMFIILIIIVGLLLIIETQNESAKPDKNPVKQENTKN